jgi:Skp family chaperone for outer membrane proteins
MSTNPKLQKYPKYQPNAQYTRTPAERAYYRREKGESVAEVLRAAATTAGDVVALGLAARISECSSRYNHFLADDLNTADGECFNGFGNLYGCGSKLCHSCVDKAAKLNRKKAREAIKETPLIRGKYVPHGASDFVVEQERLRFITLTMPKVWLSCTQSIALLSRAWGLFRKLDFTKNYFGGYVKSIEFTVRSDESYHAHIHLLAISFFLPEKTLKRLWRQCLQTAFAKSGLEWRCETKDNSPIVNIKLVDSIESALNEVCKYVTKSESWEKIPKAHLLEVANVKRWGRMFELAGRLKTTAKLIKEKKEVFKQIQADQKEGAADLNYLDTKYLTDAGKNDSNLENGEEFCQNSGVSSADFGIKREVKVKQENWREIIKEKGLEAYQKILKRQVEVMQRVRRIQLIEKYPLATFRNLAGFTWYSPNLQFIEEVPVVVIG